MTAKQVGLALLVVLFWGGNIIAIKIGCMEFPPLLLTAVRFVIVAACIVPIKRLPMNKLKPVLWLALVMGVGHFGLLFIGIGGLNAATASITLQICVPFSTLLAIWLYKEKMGWLGWLGMMLALFGIAVINGEPVRPDPFYLAMIVCSALAWAVSNIIVKKMVPVDSLTVTGWMALFSVPMLFLLSWLLESGQMEAITSATWRGWSAVLYTAFVSSIVSYSIWYYLLGRAPVSKVTPFHLLTPVVSIAGGGLVLGEAMGWPTYIGAALTIIGVGVIQLRPNKK